MIAKLQVCDSLWLQSHKSVTAKSQVCDCKVTSLWVQSHKPLTAKSQKGWCHAKNNELLNLYDCSLCWANRTLWLMDTYGGISVRGLSESKLCVRLERSGVQSMWLHVTNKKRDLLYGGWLIGGHTPRFINRTAAPGSAVFPWFKMIFWDVLLHSQRHFDSFACDSCQFHWSTQQWVKTLELKDRITPHVSFFQESLSRCENEMGKARKRKEMVQDRLGERAVCDSVVCVSLCM